QHVDDCLPGRRSPAAALSGLPQLTPPLELVHGLHHLLLSRCGTFSVVHDGTPMIDVLSREGVGPLQLERDANVEHQDNAHGQQEEGEGGQFEGVLQRFLDRTLGRLRQHRRTVNTLVHDAELHRQRNGAQRAQHPDDHHKLDGSGQLGHGVCPERVADGHVAFDGERGDGEDGRVGGRLRGQATENAEGLAEDVRMTLPELVQLLGQTEHQQQEIGHGEAEEVVVGRGVHVPVARDDDTGADVADDPRYQEDGVDEGHGNDGGKGVSLGSEVEEQGFGGGGVHRGIDHQPFGRHPYIQIAGWGRGAHAPDSCSRARWGVEAGPGCIML
ncbi:unnamed protein product, partial [Ixodes pacificus]